MRGRKLGHGELACLPLPVDARLIDAAEPAGPAGANATGHCSLRTSHAPLANHGPFELSKRTQQVHHHSTSRRASVYRLREAAKTGTGLFDAAKDAQQIGQRPREAIDLLDEHHVIYL